MTKSLRGIELRYVLTLHLFIHGPATVADMAGALTAHGFGVRGRTSKAISDALRWERGYGRVRRLGRGRYGPGWMPRGTEHRIHKRVMALRAEVADLSEAAAAATAATAATVVAHGPATTAATAATPAPVVAQRRANPHMVDSR